MGTSTPKKLQYQTITHSRDSATIVDFSKTNNLYKKRKRLMDAEKKLNNLKKRPISREQLQTSQEKRTDEAEMMQRKPIKERIQRKEEEAIGKKHDKQTFVEALEDLSDSKDNILFHTSTSMPFLLNQETITIDPVKITIVSKKAFLSQQTQIILIKDILESSVETTPFLASIQIVVSHKRDEPINIVNLKKEDAEKAVKIIQGLIIARSESPDINKVEAIR